MIRLTDGQCEALAPILSEAGDKGSPVELAQQNHGTLAVSIDGSFHAYVTPGGAVNYRRPE